MPNYTNKLNLKKPLQSEYYNIEDFNNNFDILDRDILPEYEIANCFNDLINYGVVNLPSDFAITYNGNLSVTIGEGSAWYNGYRITHSGMTLEIDPVTDGDADYLSISVAYNPDTGSPILSAAQGNSPTPPPGVLLYTITVLPTTTEITAAEVADGRTQITLKL